MSRSCRIGRPSAELEAGSRSSASSRSSLRLKADPQADIQQLRDEVDELIFDLFEIRSSRDEIRRFYRTVGRVAGDDQAASE